MRRGSTRASRPPPSSDSVTTTSAGVTSCDCVVVHLGRTTPTERHGNRNYLAIRGGRLLPGVGGVRGAHVTCGRPGAGFNPVVDLADARGGIGGRQVDDGQGTLAVIVDLGAGVIRAGLRGGTVDIDATVPAVELPA